MIGQSEDQWHRREIDIYEFITWVDSIGKLKIFDNIINQNIRSKNRIETKGHILNIEGNRLRSIHESRYSQIQIEKKHSNNWRSMITANQN